MTADKLIAFQRAGQVEVIWQRFVTSKRRVNCARTFSRTHRSVCLSWLIGTIVFLAAFICIIPSIFGQTIYEAENATLSGPLVATQYLGYSGSGYADYQNATGDYIQFTLVANSTRTYPIAFRYANGGTGDRPLR